MMNHRLCNQYDDISCQILVRVLACSYQIDSRLHWYYTAIEGPQPWVMSIDFKCLTWCNKHLIGM